MPTSCRVSWKSRVVFLEVEVKAKTIQPFDLSDAASTELWWVSLRQTRTQKHLYTHNKTTQWTLLGTARSSILYLMLSLAVFLRINNATTLYVPKALCCCFHHSLSKGALRFSGNTITKTACLASLMRGFLPLGSVLFFFFHFSLFRKSEYSSTECSLTGLICSQWTSIIGMCFCLSFGLL